MAGLSRPLTRAAIAVALTGLLSAGVFATTQASADPISDEGIRVAVDTAGELTGLSAPAGRTLRDGGSGNATEQATAHVFAFADRFGVDPNALVARPATAIPGGTVVRFDQTVDAVPVLGGQLVAVLDESGALTSIHGNLSSNLGLDATPGEKKPDALRGKALKEFADEADVAVKDLAADKPSLAWFDPAIWAGAPSTGDLTLVWSVKVEPHGLIGFGGEVLYDATTGAEVLRMSHKHEATNRVVCDVNSGSVSTSKVCVSKNATRKEGQAPTGNADVDDAYDMFGATADYYAGAFGYDLTANIGSKATGDNVKRLRAIVRACVPGYGCPMENAFWNGKGMTFGTGFASADDVIAHELTHGVTEFTSGLAYSSQSGAINESLSDIFGEYSDLVNGVGNDGAGVRWDLGEDLPASIGAIRDMADPGRFGDPDRVGSADWYTGSSNSSYVHINSGVGNKAAFLMVDGGSFNGQTITGLGLDKAEQIWWRVQNTLTSSATYGELNTVLPQACRALASSGTAGITAADCGQVDKIVLATEMNKTPAG
ncbi:MAG TPA: M4 family metallopeptidase [Phytomonospora sp.]